MRTGVPEATELGARLGIDPKTLRARARRGNCEIVAQRYTVGKKPISMYKLLSDDTDRASGPDPDSSCET